MASNIQLTKQLKDLTETEAVALLEEMKFKKITKTLMEGEFGKVTGKLFIDLDDESLRSIGIEIPFQRSQFLKSMKMYKDDDVPLDLIRTAETDKTRLLTSIQASCQELEECIQIPRKATMQEKLHALVNASLEITDVSTEEMKIYAYPVKKIDVKDLQKPLYGTNLKKIIIMGETGTGKSTLVDAFINYAVGVQMEDPFRFKLVVDEDDRANDQTVSKTSEISGYWIKDTLLDFPIQIWDTPGFGDTRGIERDESIKEQIDALLKLEDFCHVVCFVVKASVNRLTDTQRYIIDRVLLFFGKEAQENIYILATFADDSRPNVLQALEKFNNFPFDEDRWFAFNNGSLFKPASERKESSKIYWRDTNANMTKLFNRIGEIHPFSLTSTKEVIAHREDLAQNLDAIAIQVCATAYNKEKWDENLQLLELQLETVKTKGEFKEIKPQTTILKPATSLQNTICRRCKSNCHFGCRKIEIPFCIKMANLNLICKICKCGIIYHHTVCYKYEVIHETSEVNYGAGEGIQKANERYQQAKVDSKSNRNEEFAKLIELVETIREQIAKINQMAIINYSLNIGEYFKTLCEREEELNNHTKANIYKELSKEDILKTLVNNKGDAPARVVNKLMASGKEKRQLS